MKVLAIVLALITLIVVPSRADVQEFTIFDRQIEIAHNSTATYTDGIEGEEEKELTHEQIIRRPFHLNMQLYLKVTNVEDFEVACGEIQLTWLMNGKQAVQGDGLIGRMGYTSFITPCSLENSVIVASKVSYNCCTEPGSSTVVPEACNALPLETLCQEGRAESTEQEQPTPEPATEETEVTQSTDAGEEVDPDLKFHDSPHLLFYEPNVAWDDRHWTLAGQTHFSTSTQIENFAPVGELDFSKWQITQLQLSLDGNTINYILTFNIDVPANSPEIHEAVYGRDNETLLFLFYFTEASKRNVALYTYWKQQGSEFISSKSGAQQSLTFALLAAASATLLAFF